MSHSRRDFIKSVLGTSSILSLAPSLPALFQNTALASQGASSTKDTVLVVLQLSGGNDGLNTVVPYADDVYGRSRSTLRLNDKQVIKIDSHLGFHPQMKGFKKLLDDEHLTVVQGVGYPKNHRGHDEAMREWHTARPGDLDCQTGWVGRTVDAVDHPDAADVPAAFVGPIARPFALNAEASVVPSIRTTDQLSPAKMMGNAKDLSEASVGSTDRSDNPLAEVVRQGTRAAQSIGRKVETTLSKTRSSGDYPSFTLAKHLDTVSQLIRADLGIRIFFVELGGGGIGGFDNHANQRDNHAALLRELAVSIQAFVGDLKRQRVLSRVLLMTFSEFGRTVTENGRHGTNHGAAAPIFLAGGGLKAGLFGRHPDLTDLDQDAPKFHIDYRRVYATVLQNWLGFDAEAVLGREYQPIDVLA